MIVVKREREGERERERERERETERERERFDNFCIGNFEEPHGSQL